MIINQEKLIKLSPYDDVQRIASEWVDELANDAIGSKWPKDKVRITWRWNFHQASYWLKVAAVVACTEPNLCEKGDLLWKPSIPKDKDKIEFVVIIPRITEIRPESCPFIVEAEKYAILFERCRLRLSHDLGGDELFNFWRRI